MKISPQQPRGWLLRILSLLLSIGSVYAANPVVVVNRNDLSVWVGGKPAPREVNMPEGEVFFRFVPSQGNSNSTERFSFRLEGCDSEWREFTASDTGMRVAVVFYDKQGNWVSENNYKANGNSRGWKGSLDDSPLQEKMETFKVPKGAASLAIVVSSAGPSCQVGALGVGALSLLKAGNQRTGPLWRLRFQEGDGAKAPEGWSRGGSRPTMAQVVPSKVAPAGRLLAIIDEDRDCFGEWQSSRIPIDLAPGESLRMEWLESYSTGSCGGDQQAAYPNVPLGKHLFRYRKLTQFGMPTGHDGEFSLIILPPFWKRTWFIVTVGMAAAGFSVAAIRYSAWRKAQRVIAELGRMTAVQAERARIARDLHDGLGADLTQVALLSELAQVNFDQPDRARAYVDDTFRAAQKLTRAVDEVVWTLDPSNDTLARFGPYVADFVQEYLETADLDCRLTLPDRWPDQQIAPSLRHHLFLSIKEALRNIVAHAKASAVCMEIRLEDNLLALTISDDGCGFDPLGGERSRPGGGHGLANMRKRMADVGGTLDIDSAAGKGTTLRLQAKL